MGAFLGGRRWRFRGVGRAIGVGDGVFGIECDGLVEIGDSVVEVAFGFLEIAAVVVGGGEPGVECDGVVEVGDGGVVVAGGILGRVRGRCK